MRYSDNFERDFNWFLLIRHTFNFDGALNYFNSKGQDIIVSDKNGVDGKKAFYAFDSAGKILPTKHPNLLQSLLKTKGSVNLHIKMYAEDRASGLLPSTEFNDLCRTLKAPDWFALAVERQKIKYYK